MRDSRERFTCRVSHYTTMSAPTASVLMRSKKPLAQFVEFVEVKKQIATLTQTTHRRALSCESCSKRVESLEQQHKEDMQAMEMKMHALSNAFRVLSDVVVSELDTLKVESSSMQSEMNVLKEQLRWTHSCAGKMNDLEDFVQRKVVQEGAERAQRDVVVLNTVNRMEGRLETCESIVEMSRRELAEKNADDLAQHMARIDFQRACDTRIDRLEKRQRKTEDALNRIARGVAAQVRETNDALAASAAFSEANHKFLTKDADAFDSRDTTPRRSFGRDEYTKEHEDSCDFRSLGVATETAAALMSPAARRYMRDE